MATPYSYPKLGIVIVAYGNHDQEIARMLDLVEQEKSPGDQVVLVDNHPDLRCSKIAEGHPGVDHVLRPGNIGFGAGCNLGAKWLGDQIDVLLFLNPDAFPRPGSIKVLREASRRGWGAWMGLVLLPDGRVNCAGNVVHVSGLAWCAGYAELADRYSKEEEIPCLSGADLAVDRRVWEDIGGFAPEYFLYYEDIDLCFRLQLKGYKTGILPGSHIEHDYDFQKNERKWFYIERNRYLFIIRTWPLSVIVALLPMLLVIEVGLWLISVVQGRFFLKVRSTWALLKVLPFALRSRRAIQESRTIGPMEFFDMLAYRIDTPLIPSFARHKIANVMLSLYHKCARKLLSLFS